MVDEYLKPKQLASLFASSEAPTALYGSIYINPLQKLIRSAFSISLALSANPVHLSFNVQNGSQEIVLNLESHKLLSLPLKTDLFSLNGHFFIDPDMHLDGSSFELHVKDLESLKGEILLNGKLWGSSETPKAALELSSTRLEAGNHIFQDVLGSLEGSFEGNLLTGALTLHAQINEDPFESSSTFTYESKIISFNGLKALFKNAQLNGDLSFSLPENIVSGIIKFQAPDITHLPFLQDASGSLQGEAHFFPKIFTISETVHQAMDLRMETQDLRLGQTSIKEIVVEAHFGEYLRNLMDRFTWI